MSITGLKKFIYIKALALIPIGAGEVKEKITRPPNIKRTLRLFKQKKQKRDV